MAPISQSRLPALREIEVDDREAVETGCSETDDYAKTDPTGPDHQDATADQVPWATSPQALAVRH
jgi:hypothetical protein